ILILGITFKENCPDIRNTKVVDIYNTLAEYTNNITIYDPWVDVDHVKREYGVVITNDKIVLDNKYEAIILAVAHNEFVNLDVRGMLTDNGVVYDVKGILPRDVVAGRL
ncbi:MAG: UDP binding domain-containing protein, partial [Butyricimonas faecihominis]